jgi:copper homeostasis protein
MEKLLEICVDSYESAVRAAGSGADRLELCGDLLVGGVSPSPYLIRQVQKAVNIPVNVLLRPRFGDFCFTKEEKEVLLEEVEFCALVGVNGVVIGALDEYGDLDMEFLRRCADRAEGMKLTLHRCFDVCQNPYEALEQAQTLGFDTILTSGQAAKAPDGLEVLKELHRQAAGRSHIMAGSGVGPGNIREIHEKTGITHFHFSAKRNEPGPMKFKREGVPMGLPMASEFDRQYAAPDAVKAARKAIDSLK